MRRALVSIVMVLGGCFTKRVETFSHPVSFALRFTDTCDGALALEQHIGAGEYKAVEIHDATVVVDVPSMGGGYDERGGKKSRVSDPNEYQVVRLRQRERILLELSNNEMRALPRDPDGRALVRVQCSG